MQLDCKLRLKPLYWAKTQTQTFIFTPQLRLKPLYSKPNSDSNLYIVRLKPLYSACGKLKTQTQTSISPIKLRLKPPYFSDSNLHIWVQVKAAYREEVADHLGIYWRVLESSTRTSFWRLFANFISAENLKLG